MWRTRRRRRKAAAKLIRRHQPKESRAKAGGGWRICGGWRLREAGAARQWRGCLKHKACGKSINGVNGWLASGQLWRGWRSIILAYRNRRGKQYGVAISLCAGGWRLCSK